MKTGTSSLKDTQNTNGYSRISFININKMTLKFCKERATQNSQDNTEEEKQMYIFRLGHTASRV